MNNTNIKQALPYVLSLGVLGSGIFMYYKVPVQEKAETQSVTFIDAGFDTVINFSTKCTPTEFNKYSKIVRETFSQYNQYFDLYNAYPGVNNVYALNQGNSSLKVDSPLIECIELAQMIHQQNEKFDICQGKLLHVWHTYREEGISLNAEGKDGNLPSPSELDAAYNSSGSLQIEGNTISLDPNVELDLGGIAKGYTAQKVKEILLENGCDNGYINAGGNVVLLSEKEDGSSWNIGVQDPDSSASLLSISSKEPTSLVTSGDYQRFYTVNKKRYGHIIDPDTKYPATNFRSVTILYEDSALADAYSTLLFTMDLESGKKFAQEQNLEVVWVMDQDKSTAIPEFSTSKYAIYCTNSLIERIQIHE